MEKNTTIVTPCSNSECPYCKGTGIIKVDCTTTGYEAYYQCYSNGSMTEIPGETAYAKKLHQVEQENDKLKEQATGWRPLLEEVLRRFSGISAAGGQPEDLDLINKIKKFLYGE